MTTISPLDYVEKYRFDMAEIKKLFKEVPEKIYKKHEWHYTSNAVTVEAECESQVYIPPTQSKLSLEVFNLIEQSANLYTDKYPMSGPIVGSSPAKFNIYTEGNSMKKHADHIYSIFPPPVRGIPVLSFIGLLDSDFTGGELMLCNRDMGLVPGDLLVFPSCFLFPHEVKRVASGTRISFVSWGW